MDSCCDEAGRKYQDAERDGVLMLIAHFQDLLPEDSTAFRQLAALHKAVREGQHKRYVEVAMLEMRED